MAFRVYRAIFKRNGSAILIYFFVSEKPDFKKLEEQLKVLVNKSNDKFKGCKWIEHEWGIVCEAGNWRIEIVGANV